MKIKLDPGAFPPIRAHADDAGLDLRSPVDFILKPRASFTVDTGVHVEIPVGCAGFLRSKSGLMVHHDITSDGTIDAGYTGSIRVKLFNHGDGHYSIRRGDKITQLVIVPIQIPAKEEKEENMDKYTIAEEAYKRGYADGLRDAGKPRVLDYNEIEGTDAVWLEIRHTNAVEIEVAAFKTCGERMMGFEHGFFQSIALYGKQWRCWSKKPTREQMEKEEWKK